MDTHYEEDAEHSYRTTRYYAPKFFLNIDQDNELGHLLLMICAICKTEEEAVGYVDENLSISSNLKNGDIVFNIFKDDYFDMKLMLPDLIKGKYIVKAKPLIDLIWELPKDRQSKVINSVKASMVGSFLDFTDSPTNDLVEIEVVLEKYAIWNHDSNSLFVPISSPCYLQKRYYRTTDG